MGLILEDADQQLKIFRTIYFKGYDQQRRAFLCLAFFVPSFFFYGG